MRHAVLGAGGVGGLVDGTLAKAGRPVTLLVRPGRQHRYPERLSVQSETLGASRRRYGLTIGSTDGSTSSGSP